LIGFQEKFKNGKKGYIVQEVGGKSLSKTISDIQGVFHKGERVYEVIIYLFRLSFQISMNN
jgi:hypothetical protein